MVALCCGRTGEEAKKGKRVFYFGKTRGGRQKTDRGKNTKEEKTTEIGPAKKRECFSSQKEGLTEITMFATTTSTKTNSFSSRSSSSLRKPRSSAKKSINATVRVLYVSSPKPKICQIAIYPLTRVKIDQISTAYAYAYLI